MSFRNALTLAKNTFLYIGMGCALALFTGCSDRNYGAEKLLWQAEQKAAKVLQNNPQHIKEEDYEAIIAAYKKVADSFPLQAQAAKAQFAISNMYVSLGRFEEAQGELTHIIQNFSSKPQVASRAQFNIAKIFENQKKFDQALEEYEKVIDLYPLSPLGLETPLYLYRYYKNKNDAQNQEKQYRKALRHYQGIYEQYKGTSLANPIQDYIVRAHLEAEQWQEAIAIWDAIMAEDPAAPIGIKTMVSNAELLVSKLDDTPGAIAIYEQILTRYPNAKALKDIRFRLANLYLTQEKVDQAKKIYSALIEKFADDADLGIRSYLGLASCYQKEGDQEQVLNTYERIATRYPEDVRALSAPFLIYRYFTESKQDMQAKDALEKAVAQYEEKFKSATEEDHKLAAAKMLFFCYADQKNWEKSLKLLRVLSEMYPQEAGYLLSMASIYRVQLNQPEQAIEIYQEVKNKYPGNEMLISMVDKEIHDLRHNTTAQHIEN